MERMRRRQVSEGLKGEGGHEFPGFSYCRRGAEEAGPETTTGAEREPRPKPASLVKGSRKGRPSKMSNFSVIL